MSEKGDKTSIELRVLPFLPPEKPRMLAKITKGRPSLWKSLIASAVLYAESGYHTCPA